MKEVEELGAKKTNGITDADLTELEYQLLELELQIEKQTAITDNLNKRVTNIWKVLQKHEVKKMEEIKNLEEIKNQIMKIKGMGEIKSIKEVTKMTPINSIEEVNSMQEVKKITPIKQKIELTADQVKLLIAMQHSYEEAG